MNLYNLRSTAEKVYKDAYKLLASKNEDYSHEENVHSNFETVAKLCKALEVDVATPVGCIQFHILHKIQRLFKLTRTAKEPANESLLQNVADEFNYEILLITYILQRVAIKDDIPFFQKED